MKALIWIVCIFGSASIQLCFQYSGFKLGFIPMMLLWILMWVIATRLCKKWEERRVGRWTNILWIVCIIVAVALFTIIPITIMLIN